MARPTQEELGLPKTLGRYQVRKLIGRGGMGLVFAAYDAELGRDVAIKVLRSNKTGARHRARLRREAEALARLAHPNVVTVLDVGEDRGEVFVVMERVGGGSLQTWLADAHAHSTRLAAVAQAGVGLAAAHAQGIVHRDFKPANVLVADDGRVLVADFGLATQVATSARGRAGTRLYMAPEVIAGEHATVASDQYSFSLTLAQALGCDPHTVRTRGLSFGFRSRRSAVARVIERGLDDDPRARHGSMALLLAELQRAQRPSRRRRWIFAAALVAMPSPAVVGPSPEALAVTVCDHFEAYALQQRSHALVDAVQSGRAAPRPSIDIDLLRRADVLGCDDATAAVATDVGELLSRAGRFDDAAAILQRGLHMAIAADATGVRAKAGLRLATVDGVRRTNSSDAQRWLRHAQAAAERLQDNALLAQVEQIRGAVALRQQAFVVAEQHLRRAAALAPVADDPLRAAIFANLAGALAPQLRYDDALVAMAEAAQALRRAYGGDHPALASIASNRASILRQIGRVPSAAQEYKRALKLVERQRGGDHLHVATLCINLGQLELLGERPRAALRLFERAVSLRRAALEPDDVAVARAESNLGDALLALHDLEAAERMFVHAQETLTPIDPAFAVYAALGLARLDIARQQPERALAKLESIRETILRDGPLFSRGDVLAATAQAYDLAGNHEQAGYWAAAAATLYAAAGPAYLARARSVRAHKRRSSVDELDR